MIEFIAFIFLLIAIALFFVLPPLMGRYKVSQTQHNALNLAIYEQRLEELEANSNADLSDEQKQIAKKELEKSLLQDLDNSETASTGNINTHKNPILTTSVAVSIPFLALFLYSMIGPAELPEILSGAAVSQQARQDVHKQQAPDINKMVATLEQKLEQNPDNAEGWYMLARSYMYMQRIDDATQAFNKAMTLDSKNPQLLSDYAEALAMIGEGSMEGEPMELIMRALEIESMHPKSLWLAGVAKSQQGQFQEALDYWNRLMSLHEPGSEGAVELQRRIDMIKQAMVESGQTPADSRPIAQNKTEITVSIELAEELKARADPEDTLFILARAVNGPPMPLAIARKQVKDLPLTVTLDDSMAMAPNARMSNFEKVYIKAVISKSGMANTEAGDMHGRSSIIETGGKSKASVVIKNIVQ